MTALQQPLTPAFTLYGIANCDTVKKSRAWLDECGVAYSFHDFKKQGLPAHALDDWVAALGWQPLINKKATWHKLDAATQAGVVDAASAKALMLAHPSVIKRPVAQWADAAGRSQFSVGFAPQQWAAR